ncbi:hypothetical protein EI94DRAFT_529353 [Lactarius quietus]|nr:hypothetical protein EI94DRAFT_529353 [Lactarius quietus]
MDDQTYPTSPLDHPLDDTERAPSSLIDLFDGIPGEHTQQANHTSASFAPDILFPQPPPNNAQHERGLMADADVDIDPDAWVWSFDDDNDDASPPNGNRDATRGYPPAASTTVSQLPAPSSSVSPSPFAPPSRSSSHHNSKHARDLATVSTANEHVVGQADPAPRVEREDSDVEMGIVGSHHDRDQGPVQSQLRPSHDVEMLTVDPNPNHGSPAQVRPSQRPFHAHTYAM